MPLWYFHYYLYFVVCIVRYCVLWAVNLTFESSFTLPFIFHYQKVVLVVSVFVTHNVHHVFMFLHVVFQLLFEFVMVPWTFFFLFYQVNSQLISNVCTDALSAEKVIITNNAGFCRTPYS